MLRPLLLLLASGLLLALPPARAADLVIANDRPAQTLTGFGASGCWWAQAAGAWPDATRQALMRLLYDPTAGIGLTIYRHNLGAGSHADPTMPMPLRRTEAIWTPDGRIDPTRDVNARRLLRDAVHAGATQVILFAVSPPIWLTRNGRAYHPREHGKEVSNLAPEKIGDYARHLGEAAEFFLREEKLPVTILSPLNEPEWDWAKPSQEGCFYTPAQTVAVLRATDAELQRRGLPIRLEGPEGGSWKTTLPYFEAISRDPELRARLGDLAVHSYFSDRASKEKLRAWLDAHWPAARLHMSEWCQLKTGLDPGMDSALTLARTVIEDLTVGRVATWQFWLAASPHDYRDGLIHIDLEKQTFAPTKRLWAFGQFTRFLRPGTVMLPVTSAHAELPALAARLPDGRIALVCANPWGKPQPVLCQFAAGSGWKLTALTVTDATHDLASMPVTAPDPLLPAHSVSTLIFEPSSQ